MSDATSGRPITIVGLGGSLGRAPSTSLLALRAVLAGAANAGAQVRAFDVRALDLPMYEPGGKAPPSAHDLADAFHHADALVWASPMYHGTVSGAFKNALDWLELLGKRTPAYLTDKPVALVATAAGVQGLQAINTMEFVVRALRGWALPLTIPVARAYDAFDAEGQPKDAKLAQQLDLLGRELAVAARRFQRAAAPVELHATA